jgi:hypothetical protein
VVAGVRSGDKALEVFDDEFIAGALSATSVGGSSIRIRRGLQGIS